MDLINYWYIIPTVEFNINLIKLIIYILHKLNISFKLMIQELSNFFQIDYEYLSATYINFTTRIYLIVYSKVVDLYSRIKNKKIYNM